MSSTEIKRLVIAGGGTAGWLVAAAVSAQLGPVLDITLVESDDIGTIGVGEASVPTMRSFHRLAKVDEKAFVQQTKATFKLGIQFENWGNIGDSYIHSFGAVGKSTWMADFHHLWLHARSLGVGGELEDYCLELKAALAGKFAIADQPSLNYAYHLDSSLYALFLRELCQSRGVKRVEGMIQQVKQDPDTGFIQALALHSGELVEGDLFIDCTGFRGMLIGQALEVPLEDWSHWLPTDRALAVQTTFDGPIPAYTRSIAHDSGWQWRIPLQHRLGNGLVYCSQHLSDDAAYDRLVSSVTGDLLTEPRLIKFQACRRKKYWEKNCIALGLASGFLEPLESTSIHLVMIGVTRLMQMFPFGGITQALVNEFNNAGQVELDRIRDFIILHYKATNREDSDFWRQCKSQDVPETLTHKLELFKEAGRIYPENTDLFRVDSWLQVMLGQGLVPQRYHHLGELMSRDQLQQALNGLRTNVEQALARLPTHNAFLARYYEPK